MTKVTIYHPAAASASGVEQRPPHLVPIEGTGCGTPASPLRKKGAAATRLGKCFLNFHRGLTPTAKTNSALRAQGLEAPQQAAEKVILDVRNLLQGLKPQSIRVSCRHD